MGHRLEDRICELCRQLIHAEDRSAEFHAIADDLRASLRSHIQRVRAQLVKYPIMMETMKRRSRDGLA